MCACARVERCASVCACGRAYLCIRVCLCACVCAGAEGVGMQGWGQQRAYLKFGLLDERCIKLVLIQHLGSTALEDLRVRLVEALVF